MNETTIRAQELTFRYGSLTAVDHVTFEVRAGEIFSASWGPNGAGKTTVVRLPDRPAAASEGLAEVLGHDMRSDAKAVHARIGGRIWDSQLL